MQTHTQSAAQKNAPGSNLGNEVTVWLAVWATKLEPVSPITHKLLVALHIPSNILFVG